MKRYSASLVFRDLQTKTREIPPHNGQNGYREKDKENKCWRACGGKGTLVHCWWECKLVHSLRKTIWKLLKRFKIELPYAPAVPLLHTYPNKMKH